MIQEIKPRTFYNQFHEERIGKGDSIICFHNDLIYVNQEKNDLEYISYEAFCTWQEEMNGTGKPVKKGTGDNSLAEKEFHFIYLFSIDEQKYFLLREDVELSLPGFTYCKMFDVRRRAPKYQVMAASTAWHLYVWYRDNRFCGRCGQETLEDREERMLKCPHCGNMIFPKVAPAVIVGVIDGDKILMTKYAHREYKRYALIAGFNEIGETIEETVEREVMEEVGLHVKHIRYYKSQPWGFDQNLLLGFFCELDDSHKIHMDEKELALAEWVRREDIPDYKEHLSLTHEMMQLFKNGKEPL
ncbi:MAG: NAD(+) diphosphatase [Lachnospiraceae bacterium]|nr:NAD(+) diphosphatase [Lachnospiraceae bacterium]